MPTQKLIDWSTRIVNKLLVEMLAGNAESIASEADNLVIVLTKLAI